MGKNAYTKCREIIKTANSKGFINEITLKDLVTIIKINVGANQRTVSNYLILLREWGFIENRGYYIYKLKQTDKEEKIKELKERLKQLCND